MLSEINIIIQQRDMYKLHDILKSYGDDQNITKTTQQVMTEVKRLIEQAFELGKEQ